MGLEAFTLLGLQDSDDGDVDMWCRCFDHSLKCLNKRDRFDLGEAGQTRGRTVVKVKADTYGCKTPIEDFGEPIYR